MLEQNVTALQQMFHKKEKIKDMDWYVTKLLPLMTGGTLQSFWQDFVLADEEKARCLDVYTHTVAMSALNK